MASMRTRCPRGGAARGRRVTGGDRRGCPGSSGGIVHVGYGGRLDLRVGASALEAAAVVGQDVAHERDGGPGGGVAREPVLVAAGVVLEVKELAGAVQRAEGVDVGLQLGRDVHVRHVRRSCRRGAWVRPKFQRAGLRDAPQASPRGPGTRDHRVEPGSVVGPNCPPKEAVDGSLSPAPTTSHSSSAPSTLSRCFSCCKTMRIPPAIKANRKEHLLPTSRFVVGAAPGSESVCTLHRRRIVPPQVLCGFIGPLESAPPFAGRRIRT
jgi:hypothetical protein